MRRMLPAAAVASSAVIALGLLSGCAPADAEAAALPAGVTVGLAQLRSDVAGRQAQVVVTNGGAEPLQLGAVAVDDPRFDGTAERVVDRTSTVAAGSSVDIRVQLPPMACDTTDAADSGQVTGGADAGVDAGATRVTIAYSSGGSDGVATAPIGDALGFLPRLYDRECRAAALAEAATVALAEFAPSTAPDPATLHLRITPTGDAAATIRDIQGTNLLSFEGATADALVLDVEIAAGDAGPVVVELPFVPFRCDPHVVQEDKRGTVFTLDVEVGGESGTVELAASEELRGRILTWVGEWCGFGR